MADTDTPFREETKEPFTVGPPDPEREVGLETSKSSSLLPGVARMEVISKRLGFPGRCMLYASMLLLSFAVNLNQLTLGTYQGYATSSWQHHSLLSTINVIRGVIATAVMPVVAKFSDLIGRLECIVLATVFYAIGIIIQSSATSIGSYAAGALFVQIGYTSLQLLVEILVSDTTSLRSRLLFLFLPNMPNIINVWVSGNVTSSVLSTTTWRWGIGMWGIICTVCSLPFVAVLAVAGRRASRQEAYKGVFSLGKGHLLRMPFSQIPKKLDLVGLFLLAVLLSLLLLPLTLAGGESQKWKSPGILTPIVLGVFSIPLFIYWETKAPFPILPFHILKDRAVFAALGIAFCASTAYATQANFLFTVLLVGYDFTIMTATRIASVSTFCEAAGGVLIGTIMYKFQRCKPLVIFGAALWFVAYGLMYYYRGGATGSSQAGMIAGQVLVGFAAAMAFPNIVIAMTLVDHENLAVLVSVWLAINWAGFALGNCVSGAIWTQTLFTRLHEDLDSINVTLADAVYAEPLYVVPLYPVGTPERAGIVESYKYIQKLLTITGMGFTVPLLMLSLYLRNPKLPKRLESIF